MLRVTAWLIMAATTMSAPAHALDIYIGTLSVDDGKAILTRCDIASNRYELRDGPAKKPVADVLSKLVGMKAPVYAEVVGDYAEDNGTNVLVVEAIDNLADGKSCHLLDALDGI